MGLLVAKRVGRDGHQIIASEQISIVACNDLQVYILAVSSIIGIANAVDQIIFKRKYSIIVRGVSNCTVIIGNSSSQVWLKHYFQRAVQAIVRIIQYINRNLVRRKINTGVFAETCKA